MLGEGRVRPLAPGLPRRPAIEAGRRVERRRPRTRTILLVDDDRAILNRL